MVMMLLSAFHSGAALVVLMLGHGCTATERISSKDAHTHKFDQKKMPVMKCHGPFHAFPLT